MPPIPSLPPVTIPQSYQPLDDKSRRKNTDIRDERDSRLKHTGTSGRNRPQDYPPAPRKNNPTTTTKTAQRHIVNDGSDPFTVSNSTTSSNRQIDYAGPQNNTKQQLPHSSRKTPSTKNKGARPSKFKTTPLGASSFFGYGASTQNNQKRILLSQGTSPSSSGDTSPQKSPTHINSKNAGEFFTILFGGLAVGFGVMEFLHHTHQYDTVNKLNQAIHDNLQWAVPAFAIYAVIFVAACYAWRSGVNNEQKAAFTDIGPDISSK